MAKKYLACLYSQQRRLAAAGKLQEEVLEEHRKQKRLDHLDIPIDTHDLAITYFRQGQLESAAPLEEEAFGKTETLTGR
jgi:hypothetical protein